MTLSTSPRMTMTIGHQMSSAAIQQSGGYSGSHTAGTRRSRLKGVSMSAVTNATAGRIDLDTLVDSTKLMVQDAYPRTWLPRYVEGWSLATGPCIQCVTVSARSAHRTRFLGEAHLSLLAQSASSHALMIGLSKLTSISI